MSDQERNELKQALAQVRTAYRLLHAYQRRIFDLLSVLDGVLASAKVPFQQWNTSYHNPPTKSDKSPFARKWAWDFLPGYDFYCLWENAEAKQGWRRIAIEVASDTSFEAQKRNQPFGEVDPAVLPPVEETTSALWLSLCYAESGCFKDMKVWEPINAHKDAYNGEAHMLEVQKQPFKFIFKEIDLCDLPDEAAVTERLVKPLHLWLKTGEYP